MYPHPKQNSSSSSDSFPWKAFFVIATLIMLTGCGNQLDLAEVSGVVTIDSTPVSGVIVGFTPKEGGRSSGNMTNGSGEYRLVFNRNFYGALVGDHKVTARLGRAPNSNIPKAKEKQLVLEFDATVKPGENTINFELLPD